MRAIAPTAAQRRAENALIRRALKVLEDRLEYERPRLGSPKLARDFVRLKMARLEHEVFAVLWLNAQNQLIEFEELFRGTLTQTSVYPREVVKAGLAANAASCILAHNHPSGESTPSAEDEALTRSLREALGLVDIRVLDHIIVAGAKMPASFAEMGLL
jgi:DNA repair protein RadC